MTPKLFSELNLSPELLRAIEKLGFEQAAPIQAEAIPVLMAGKDVVGQSQTGSGKTAAFAIPAIEKVDPQQRSTQVLILCPTRELAVQVSEEVHKLAFFKRGVHALPIYGGQSYDRQLYGLKQGAHIVIGTPGRVMDHMRRGTLKLDALKMVILDEVDVMLNMGFRDDIEIILQGTPATRQTVFFSATIPRPIQDLIQKYAREPQSVRIEQKAVTVPTVEQVYYEVDRRWKIELLTRLIDIHDYKLGIVFCNTKRMVDDLVDHLNAQGYSADRLHGDMSQNMRDRVMNKFRKSGLEFLVATDVAARGIDVEDVQVVFNYDLPYDPEDYVHRIGRTGRAGRSGRAISFVAGRELFQIQQIERFTKTRVHRAKVPTPGEVEEARTNVFLDKLRATLTSGEYTKQDHLVERLLEEGFTSTDIVSALMHLLQKGEQAKPAAATAPQHREENYDRPERPERPERSGGFRERRDDRFQEREPRAGKFRDAAERPARFPEQREAPPRKKFPVASGVIAKTAPPSVAPKERTMPAAATETKEKIMPVAAGPISDDARKMLARPGRVAPDEEPPKKSGPATERGPGAKASRATPVNQTRLYMNVGAEMQVEPRDVVGAIMGETGLPPETIGRIDVRERHLFVDVASHHANAIIAKLNRTRIKGERLKVKVA
ncbi:MAG TPA: DEAD/DEAH box helicase [Candidatus Limnocylindria bacterium]|nr:DEAD/DEAH box helicase [Candidatus Limnocylindria bacterium]